MLRRTQNTARRAPSLRQQIQPPITAWTLDTATTAAGTANGTFLTFYERRLLPCGAAHRALHVCPKLCHLLEAPSAQRSAQTAALFPIYWLLTSNVWLVQHIASAFAGAAAPAISAGAGLSLSTGLLSFFSFAVGSVGLVLLLADQVGAPLPANSSWPLNKQLRLVCDLATSLALPHTSHRIWRIESILTRMLLSPTRLSLGGKLTWSCSALGTTDLEPTHLTAGKASGPQPRVLHVRRHRPGPLRVQQMV